MRLVGVGIDLVSLDRAARFLLAHGQAKTRGLFAPSERNRYRKKSLTKRSLAKLFAAKEAFFKALGRSWMGLEGFRAIDVDLRPRGRFHARAAKGSIGNNFYEAEGSFVAFDRGVGAYITVWAS